MFDDRGDVRTLPMRPDPPRSLVLPVQVRPTPVTAHHEALHDLSAPGGARQLLELPLGGDLDPARQVEDLLSGDHGGLIVSGSLRLSSRRLAKLRLHACGGSVHDAVDDQTAEPLHEGMRKDRIPGLVGHVRVVAVDDVGEVILRPNELEGYRELYS